MAYFSAKKEVNRLDDLVKELESKNKELEKEVARLKKLENGQETKTRAVKEQIPNW